MESLKIIRACKIKLYVRILFHISGNCVIFMLRFIAGREILEAIVHGACIYGGKTNSAR